MQFSFSFLFFQHFLCVCSRVCVFFSYLLSFFYSFLCFTFFRSFLHTFLLFLHFVFINSPLHLFPICSSTCVKFYSSFDHLFLSSFLLSYFFSVPFVYSITYSFLFISFLTYFLSFLFLRVCASVSVRVCSFLLNVRGESYLLWGFQNRITVNSLFLTWFLKEEGSISCSIGLEKVLRPSRHIFQRIHLTPSKLWRVFFIYCS